MGAYFWNRWADDPGLRRLFAELGLNVADAPPLRPTALTQDELLALFDGADTGAGVTLVPATDEDMRGANTEPKVSLEVIYDDA
jgi:chlorophyllide a reductase subunit X